MNNGSSVAELVKRRLLLVYYVDRLWLLQKLTYADPSTMQPLVEMPTFNIYTSDEAIEQDAETYEFVLQWQDEDGLQGSREVLAEEVSEQEAEHKPNESRT